MSTNNGMSAEQSKAIADRLSEGDRYLLVSLGWSVEGIAADYRERLESLGDHRRAIADLKTSYGTVHHRGLLQKVVSSYRAECPCGRKKKMC